MRSTIAALIAATALGLGACGDDDEASAGMGTAATATAATATAATSPPAAKPARRKRGTTIRARASQYGTVLFDGRGYVVYLFTRDGRDRTRCYGDCAEAWPPVLTKAKPRAGNGARASLLGTVRRRDGKRQVTYRGRPLYYYEHDGKGQILCHDVFEFGGDWLVVKPNGRAAA